jgi:broad specificity phosphatase PhoE
MDDLNGFNDFNDLTNWPLTWKSEQMITRFALLRHAETEWNRKKLIQGQQDAPLTSNGRRQAQRWGLALAQYELDHMITSDLGRARLTGTLMNLKLDLPHSEEPRLREQDWGRWAGLNFSDLLKVDELRAQEKLGWHFRPLEGESRLEVFERSRQALVDAAHRLKGKRVLVVTHGGVIKCLLYRLCRKHFLPGEPPLLEPYRLHWLSYDGQVFQIDRMNEKI